MALANPVLNAEAFKGTWAEIRTPADVMTVSGTAIKAIGLFAILMASATWAWTQLAQGTLNMPILFGSLIGGLILGFVTSFNPRWSPVTAPIYAALEGVFLGTLSSAIEAALPQKSPLGHGLVYDAVGLTAGVLFLMLFLYATRLIRVTGRLVAGITAATGAVVLVYLVQMVLSLFFHTQIPGIFGSGMIGIGFSVVVVAIAAFNLLINFDVIERGAAAGSPRFMEWYGAFGLMVTLIWLYIEILDLLMKLQRRQN
jgi:uncharacterized YccA/Bax inhibitor family protein